MKKEVYPDIIYDERQVKTIFEIINHIENIVKNDKFDIIQNMDGAQKVKELETFKQALKIMAEPQKIDCSFDIRQTEQALSIILGVTSSPRGAIIKYAFDTIAGYYEELMKNLVA